MSGMVSSVPRKDSPDLVSQHLALAKAMYAQASRVGIWVGTALEVLAVALYFVTACEQ